MLRAIEAFAIRVGARAVVLQDAAFRVCPNSKWEHDLGFFELLTHGQTWYERQGFRPDISQRRRRAVAVALSRYRSIRVLDILQSVRRQNAVLLHDPGGAFAAVPLMHAYSAVPPSVSWRPSARRLLSQRLKLEALLAAAPNGIALGEWLPSLQCRDYAEFMLRMYGGMRGQGEAVALARVGRIKTPSVDEFVRANALRRWSHKITWSKLL